MGAEVIVTRDIRHFSRVKDEVKIVTPEELVLGDLAELKEPLQK